MDLLRWGFGGGGGVAATSEPQPTNGPPEMTKAGHRAEIHAMALQNLRAQAAQSRRPPPRRQSEAVDPREESDAGSDTSSEGSTTSFVGAVPPKREQLMFKARLAREAERYDEMERFMILLVREREQAAWELTDQEQEFLETALEKTFARRLTALELLGKMQAKEDSTFLSDDPVQAAKMNEILQFKKIVTEECAAHCESVITLTSQSLIPTASKPPARVFYNMLLANFTRYLAGTQQGVVQYKSIQTSRAKYTEALEIAERYLAPYDPLRLSLLTRWAMFNYEILDDKDEALKTARDAFYSGVEGMDHVSDDMYGNTYAKLCRLRAFIRKWGMERKEDAILSSHISSL